LVKYLDDVSNKNIIELNIPTGIPLVYELNENMTPIRSYYLGDPSRVKKATETVKHQGKMS
jgi:2,3-bisphosphoglycerate-dependent phosphoglycerate mutase